MTAAVLGLGVFDPWHNRVCRWLFLGLTAHGCACAPALFTREQKDCLADVDALEDAALARCDGDRVCKARVRDRFDGRAEACVSERE